MHPTRKEGAESREIFRTRSEAERRHLFRPGGGQWFPFGVASKVDQGQGVRAQSRSHRRVEGKMENKIAPRFFLFLFFVFISFFFLLLFTFSPDKVCYKALAKDRLIHQ